MTQGALPGRACFHSFTRYLSMHSTSVSASALAIITKNYLYQIFKSLPSYFRFLYEYGKGIFSRVLRNSMTRYVGWLVRPSVHLR